MDYPPNRPLKNPDVGLLVTKVPVVPPLEFQSMVVALTVTDPVKLNDPTIGAANPFEAPIASETARTNNCFEFRKLPSFPF